MIKPHARLAVIALLTIAYLILWVGGAGSHLFSGGTPKDAQWAAPVFLLLAGLLVIASASLQNLAGLIPAALFGFIAEVIGVGYGFLFGEYSYTDALSIKLFDVPLVMISAWMALAAYVREMTHHYRWPAWLEILIASLWMTAIDLVIDPLAAGPLDYWRWAEAGSYYGIPARNFAGWFVVSVCIFGFLRIVPGQRWATGPTPALIGLSIILFFTLLASIHGLALAAVFGVSLCLLHLAMVYSRVASRNQI